MSDVNANAGGAGQVPAKRSQAAIAEAVMADGAVDAEEEQQLYDIQSIRRSIRRWTIVGISTVLMFFGGFVGWAAVADLDSASVATGQVAVYNNRQAVQHLEGGIVREIKARDGDVVKAGDVLLLLDDTSARANLQINEKRNRGLLAMEARLVAERDQLQAIRFPSQLLDDATKDEETRDILQAQITV
ncbi:MAG: biotin/lipoyl-binding protein, partial [Alphaproteobacteria bacterium]